MCKKLMYPSLLVLMVAAAVGQAADYAWIRAVYSDTRYATAWQGNSDATRDALVAAGYKLLNADELKTWMEARIADRALSVVVFCRDSAPNTVTETMSSSCTLRKYLDAGGKIVWYADIPFYYQSNATATNTTWGDGGAPAILGFNTSSAPRDSQNTVTITPLGTAWGLTTTWNSQRPATASVILPNGAILATDNAGNAAAWAKFYVPNDTFRGFVRFRDTSGQPNVQDLMRVAEYIALKASNPQPADGATNVNMPLLQWSPSSFALFHNVYLGTTPTLTEANLIGAKQMFTMLYYVQGLQPGTTYYWRVDEVEADGSVRAGDVWKFTATPKTAWNPKPGDGGAYVAPNVVLEWLPGMNVMTHDVYFGSDRAAVETGTPDTKKATGQGGTTYTPAGLERGKTYYWRVDEAIAGGAKVPGAVWSFAVRPVIAKIDPNMVGWWKLDDEKSGLAVDYSGFDNYGTIQGATFVEGTLGDALQFNGTQWVDLPPALVKSKLGSVTCWVKTTQTTVGTIFYSNAVTTGDGYGGENELHLNVDTGQARFFIEGGNNDVSVRSGAINTGEWQHVAAMWDAKTATVYVNGVKAAQASNTGNDFAAVGMTRMGRPAASSRYYIGVLDDVRLYNKAISENELRQAMRGDPLIAWDPQPARGATLDIRDATNLKWSAGEGAAKHDVYLGKDKDAVKTATATSPLYQGRQTGTSLALDGKVEFGGGAYFWRVDEVEANGTTIHKGIVWSFTIPGYLIVDEFEGYTDKAGEEIFSAWIDGYVDKSSGSVVGYETAVNGTFGERTITHGGRQSMPMDYDNGKSPFYSEAVRTFAPLQDWTGSGVTDLSLWVRGYPDLTSVAVTETAGKMSLTGSGTDIWNNSDQFTFAYKTLNGDGSIVARVVSNGTGTNTWAKGGVMIRDSLDGGSTFANTVITGGGGNGASFQYRLVANGGCGNSDSTSVVAPPYWVKIERVGDNLNGYLSTDGKTWRPQGVPQTIAMTAPVYIGLCVTSHAATEQRTFQFDSIATTGGVSGAWQGASITSPRHNSVQPMYVVVEDSAGKTATATNATAANAGAWTEWKVPLSSLTGVNLAKVKKVYIGVGDKKAPVADGSGRVFIDDIRVIKQ